MGALDGKVAVVTGGNSGIGKAIVLELAGQGANVVIDYVVHPEATEEVERDVAALGARAVGVQADVSKVADLTNLIAQAVQAFSRVDVMVNNAGVETRTSILDTTEAQYERVLDINLKSAFFGTQLAAKQMIDQGSRRAHHQHQLGPRGLAHARQHRLLPVQGRHAHAHPHRRAWSSLRTGSWSWASARGRWRPPSTSTTTHDPSSVWTTPSRWGAWPSPGRSPSWSHSSPATAPATPPPRPSSSTAA